MFSLINITPYTRQKTFGLKSTALYLDRKRSSEH